MRCFLRQHDKKRTTVRIVMLNESEASLFLNEICWYYHKIIYNLYNFTNFINLMNSKPMKKPSLIIFLITIILLTACHQKPKEKPAETIAPKQEQENAFKKQGDLNFISAENKLLVSIAIEIAKDEFSREKGLMYRRNMEELQGMLFVFDDAAPRNFWMKNTYISLDIIYVGADKKIVSIQKSAIPLSEESLPSNKDAMYVVEVNAGFCDKYTIKAGDKVSF
ncbi:MAG: DUF192 domain-containing protein [Bacteroidetes bacterium]|nr:DUF192 domain-containing protein [Bacteroidota bacterium]